MQYFLSFFRTELLFSMRPNPLEGFGLQFLLIFFGATFLFGIIFQYLIQKKSYDTFKRRGFQKIRTLCFTMGVFGFIYIFFAYEGAYFLSARIWLLVWGISLLIWMFFISRYFIKDIPRFKDERERKRSFEKYLTK